MEVAKRCIRCGEVKPLSEFHKNPEIYESGVKHRKQFDKSWIMRTLGW